MYFGVYEHMIYWVPTSSGIVSEVVESSGNLTERKYSRLVGFRKAS